MLPHRQRDYNILHVSDETNSTLITSTLSPENENECPIQPFQIPLKVLQLFWKSHQHINTFTYLFIFSMSAEIAHWCSVSHEIIFTRLRLDRASVPLSGWAPAPPSTDAMTHQSLMWVWTTRGSSAGGLTVIQELHISAVPLFKCEVFMGIGKQVPMLRICSQNEVFLAVPIKHTTSYLFHSARLQDTVKEKDQRASLCNHHFPNGGISVMAYCTKSFC